MSKIFQLEGGQYEHPNEYKLVSTVRGTTILQPVFGTVIIEGDVIEASTHNTIQKNGVLASKVNVTMESTDTVLVPTDMTIESDLFNELKIILLFETGTTLPSNSFIKLKETNVPIANVNDYVVNANTPLLFLYFDSKFYAYKAGSGTSKLDDLSDVAITTPTNGQALVYDGTNFVNQTVEEPVSKLDDLSDVTLTSPTSGQALVYNGSKFVNKEVKALLDTTDFQATETIKGISQIATQTEVDNGLEDTKIVTSKKLKARLDILQKSIFENMHPIGSIYTTTSAGFDPNAMFGGLWERYAQGRTLIGVSDYDPTFSSVGLTGGTKTKTLDLTNLPAHTHTASFTGDAIEGHSHTVNDHAHLLRANTGNAIDEYSDEISVLGTGAGYASGLNYGEDEPSWDTWTGQPHYHQIDAWTGGSQPGTSGSGAHTPTGSVTVASTGQGKEFDVLNPYITVYFWKRVG